MNYGVYGTVVPQVRGIAANKRELSLCNPVQPQCTSAAYSRTLQLSVLCTLRSYTVLYEFCVITLNQFLSGLPIWLIKFVEPSITSSLFTNSLSFPSLTKSLRNSNLVSSPHRRCHQWPARLQHDYLAVNS